MTHTLAAPTLLLESSNTDSYELDPTRLLRAKRAYTTRFLDAALRVDPTGYRLISGSLRPAPGDIVLARVVEIGQHQRLESPTRRRQHLHVGDEILVAYGHRYAPDQFEATVPEDLGPVHLVAAGGVAARVVTQHARMDPATVLEPLGFLAHSRGIANLTHFAQYNAGTPAAYVDRDVPTIAVLGSSMNAGKSTTLASFVHGLTLAGLRVAAGKVTGTGAGGDPAMFTDAGAIEVVDFTDFGVASTFRMEFGYLRELATAIRAHLLAQAPDVVVLEIADGVFQDETSRLLHDAEFTSGIDRVLFATADALGASAGVPMLRTVGLDVAAVSGCLTSSPLATREARAALDVSVIDTFDLATPHVATRLLR
ncbi:hypothetical protein [Cumulibacter soli]|uniref:hypothetical protein n=1 Tax=Cumulibacter soli TaxID=2546344 RepID=UPI001ABB7282|nr:hypothetical protein [Cumulibacter soli]